MDIVNCDRPQTAFPKGRVFIIEDEELVRDALGPLLEGEGYQVSFAENGREALDRLHTDALPDVIVLDLRMPVMDGWEFRAVQKEDSRLRMIPIVAISADGSPQATAISAHAYLRKPVRAKQFLATIDGIRVEQHRQDLAAREQLDQLAALGRLAAGVGHQINNPLAVVMLNVRQALKDLRPSISALEPPSSFLLTGPVVEELRSRLAGVADMLDDCKVSAESIRDTMEELQRLSHHSHAHAQGATHPGVVGGTGSQLRPLAILDIHELLEKSLAEVSEQIRARARLSKHFGEVPRITGDRQDLTQLFTTLLMNAAWAIRRGAIESNDIAVTTRCEEGANGAEVVVEIRDSGEGMPAHAAAHVFEPFFINPPHGFGGGLALSLGRLTVLEHGGRIDVESAPCEGSVFRVYLPVVACAAGGGGADEGRGASTPVKDGAG